MVLGCPHEAAAVSYHVRVTSFHHTLKFIQTYFKDAQMQGRLAGRVRDSPDGARTVFVKPLVVFLMAYSIVLVRQAAALK